ncbi:nucleotidyl transferase AbiEii/AbiGii toxin family protein [Candidatus Woesearchaeota archaeon]|nr:nucleotidyl transferase AbiEii/AbiGii toxin family protein [Candidatus Woesearchaeota archaeon]
MLPLILRLKRESHKQIALAQDIIVQEMYKIFNDAVLHGGTAIWRCYKGKRFSEDIDVYLKGEAEKINLFFSNLEKRGFTIKKKKIGENSLFSLLSINRTEVRFEALFKKKSGVLKEYETAEGNLITVYTLAPEEFINEKAEAYLKRLKVRDLYDVFFLLRYAQHKDKVKLSLQKITKGFKAPRDEKDLKILILEGVVPNVQDMKEYIKSYME